MPKITVRRLGETEVLSFTKDARLILTDDTLTIYPDSPTAGDLLDDQSGVRVKVVESDSQGNLFRWDLVGKQLDIPETKIVFAKDNFPRLKVVNPRIIISNDAPKLGNKIRVTTSAPDL